MVRAAALQERLELGEGVLDRVEGNRCEWATSRHWLVMADTVPCLTGRAVQWIAAGMKAAIKAGIKVSPIAGLR